MDRSNLEQLLLAASTDHVLEQRILDRDETLADAYELGPREMCLLLAVDKGALRLILRNIKPEGDRPTTVERPPRSRGISFR